MKKNILSILLVLVLVMSLVFVLVACNNSNDTKNNTQTPTTNGDSGNNGGNSGGQQGGGDSGGQQGGGQQGGGTGTSSVTFNTAQQIATAIGTTFKIVATNLSGNAPTTCVSDGTYFYVDNSYAKFSKKYGDNNFQYYAQTANNKYIKMYSTFYDNDPLISVLSTGNLEVLFMYAGQTISYQNMEATTFLSRPAKKYTYLSTNPTNAQITYTEEIIVDDATGACLKHDGSGSSKDSFTNGTVKVSAQVSDFTYGTANASAIQSFLQPFIDKVDVNEWDTTFLATIGLDDLSAPSTADNIYMSYWYSGDSMRTSTYPDWTVIYTIESASQSLLQDTMLAYLQSVYNAGAKLDYNGNVETFDNLFEDYYGDGRKICLDAYVQGYADYNVEAECTYNANVDNPYWKVEIEFQRTDY
ncbi:MAG: hypothetical protein J5656_06605 [Clostridia bacterium]|nr:hypothetical protein [Clostridia bacterium]